MMTDGAQKTVWTAAEEMIETTVSHLTAREGVFPYGGLT